MELNKACYSNNSIILNAKELTIKKGEHLPDIFYKTSKFDCTVLKL